MKAIFVSSTNALGRGAGPWGGVQICTNEYLNVLKKAGFDTSCVEFDLDRRLINRIQKRFHRRPYRNVSPPELSTTVLSSIATLKPEVVFLNLADLAPLAKVIRLKFGDKVKIILLSHGLGCADILHEIRYRSIDSGAVAAGSRDLKWLAGHLVEEAEQRKYIDHVFCLSEFDVGLERWVGARSVSWLPRIVTVRPLPWAPLKKRIGFVGTLDHAPNAEGLILFLKALEKTAENGSPVVRVIGGPKKVGAQLARRFGRVEYLGQTDDNALEAEASTWTCAVNPLFCYSRGCSTKLAIMLGWGIPIVTTPPGCRGYVWREGEIPQAEDAIGLAKIACGMLEEANRLSARSEIVRVAASSPTIDDISDMVKRQVSDITHA